MTETTLLAAAVLLLTAWWNRWRAVPVTIGRDRLSATAVVDRGPRRDLARLGGMFGRRRDDQPRPDQPPPWRRPFDPYGNDEDGPSQVRVLPPEEPDLPEAPEPVEPPSRDAGRDMGLMPIQPSRVPATPPAFAEPAIDESLGELLPLAESERLERWTSLLRLQAGFYNEAADVIERHTRALTAYLEEQRVNMQRMMAKLEDQLRPLKEYIATEQANLDRLRQTMERQPSGLVASHFQEYLNAQQERIDRGKEEVATRYQPFQEYFAEQQNLVETLLSRFDDDFKRLTATLNDQRKLVERVQKGLGDGEYRTAMDFLAERQRAWVDFARTAGEDPRVVYDRLQQIQRAFSSSGRVSGVLEHLFALAQAADERLAEYVPPMSRQRQELEAADDAQVLPTATRGRPGRRSEPLL